MFTFRAMNTDVSVSASTPDEELTALDVAQVFWRAERTFSRFAADSELTRLNRARGPMQVTRELFDALLRARAHMHMTNGMFDPAVGSVLVALGYDRSFAPDVLDRACPSEWPASVSFREVVLDEATCVVERPESMHIDLGGMIKGATVDAAAALLSSSGMIDAGGDAVLRGRPPQGEDWLVEVEDPRQPSHTLVVFALTDRAVATSSASRRTWRVGRSMAHHLIDPRTREPVVTDLLQVTVTAPHAELSDVLAKTTFLLGEREGRRFLEQQQDTGAVLVRRDGRVVIVGAVDVREVNDG